jgi:hypothetical protein
VIEQADVMGAIASGAGGAVALGAGFATISAGVAKIADGNATAPANLARGGIVAFFLAILASLGTVAWTLGSASGWDAASLGWLYGVSVVLFGLSMFILIVVFVWSATILWNANLTNFIKRFS